MRSVTLPHPASPFLCALLLAPLLVSALPDARATPARVPGTHVTLVPPAGFLPAQTFAGYRRADIPASITVTEMNVPAQAMIGHLDKHTLAARGLRLLSSSKAAVAGRAGMLYSLRGRQHGLLLRKWMLVFGDDKHTVLLTASFPARSAGKLAAALKHALMGAGWDPTVTVGPQEGLPFRIDVAKGLAIARRVGNMLLLARDDQRPPVTVDDPLLVVGDAPAEPAIRHLAAYARHRLLQLDQVRNVRDVQGGAVTVGGMPAYELTASANDAATGALLSAYQLMVPRGERYFLVQGLVGAAGESTWLPRFREVAHSIRPATR